MSPNVAHTRYLVSIFLLLFFPGGSSGQSQSTSESDQDPGPDQILIDHSPGSYDLVTLVYEDTFLGTVDSLVSGVLSTTELTGTRQAFEKEDLLSIYFNVGHIVSQARLPTSGEVNKDLIYLTDGTLTFGEVSAINSAQVISDSGVYPRRNVSIIIFSPSSIYLGEEPYDEEPLDEELPTESDPVEKDTQDEGITSGFCWIGDIEVDHDFEVGRDLGCPVKFHEVANWRVILEEKRLIRPNDEEITARLNSGQYTIHVTASGTEQGTGHADGTVDPSTDVNIALQYIRSASPSHIETLSKVFGEMSIEERGAALFPGEYEFYHGAVGRFRIPVPMKVRYKCQDSTIERYQYEALGLIGADSGKLSEDLTRARGSGSERSTKYGIPSNLKFNYDLKRIECTKISESTPPTAPTATTTSDDTDDDTGDCVQASLEDIEADYRAEMNEVQSRLDELKVRAQPFFKALDDNVDDWNLANGTCALFDITTATLTAYLMSGLQKALKYKGPGDTEIDEFQDLWDARRSWIVLKNILKLSGIRDRSSKGLWRRLDNCAGKVPADTYAGARDFVKNMEQLEKLSVEANRLNLKYEQLDTKRYFEILKELTYCTACAEETGQDPAICR